MQSVQTVNFKIELSEGIGWSNDYSDLLYNLNRNVVI